MLCLIEEETAGGGRAVCCLKRFKVTALLRTVVLVRPCCRPATVTTPTKTDGVDRVCMSAINCVPAL
jgi:hypothetical protein